MYVRNNNFNVSQVTLYGSDSILNLPKRAHYVRYYGHFYRSIILRPIPVKITVNGNDYNFYYNGSVDEFNLNLKSIPGNNFECRYSFDCSSILIINNYPFRVSSVENVLKCQETICDVEDKDKLKDKNYVYIHKPYGYLLEIIDKPKIYLTSQNIATNKLEYNKEIDYIKVSVEYPRSIITAKLVVSVCYDM